MTTKKEAQHEAVDASDADALAAQFRPAWETGEGDTITSSAPRPIERVTAQPRTDEDPTVKPVMVVSQEESGERQIPGLLVHEEPTLRVPVLEEVTQVDRTLPTMAAPKPVSEKKEPEPAVSSAAPPESGNFVLSGTARRFDARAIANSDPEEMALSPMRPRAITVPTGFEARPAPPPNELALPTPAWVPEDRNRPTADVALPMNKKPARIVFGAMGALVLLIGLGVIVKAAVGGGSTGATATSTTETTKPPAQAEATKQSEPSQAEPKAAPKPKNDIPPPPPAEEATTTDSPAPAAAAPTGTTQAAAPKPVAAARPQPPVKPPIATPARPPAPPAANPAPARTAPAAKGGGKGGIVRDTPF